MIRPLFVLTIILCGSFAVQAEEFPFPTPRCGQTFITFYQTGTITSDGVFLGSTTYRSVRKTDILSLSKHPGIDSVLVIVFRATTEPGYEIARVAPNTYMRILECLD